MWQKAMNIIWLRVAKLQMFWLVNGDRMARWRIHIGKAKYIDLAAI